MATYTLSKNGDEPWSILLAGEDSVIGGLCELLHVQRLALSQVNTATHPAQELAGLDSVDNVHALHVVLLSQLFGDGSAIKDDFSSGSLGSN